MGLDSNLTAAGAPIGASKPAEAREGAAVARATTASMQNLLAQYFAAQEAARQTQAEAAPASPAHDHQAAIAAAMEPGLAANDHEARVPETQESAAEDEESAWPDSARATVAALRGEIARLRAGMERQAVLLQSARTQADGDVLTPTLNRRAFLREVQRAMADCRRYGEEAALIYIDMDGFKGINDRHGHAAGDAALIHVAEILNANVREGDSVGRLGGDEFAVLLRHADLKSARIKALKLESELASTDFEHEGFSLKTGASFGVRAWAGQASAEAWLSEADAAMFLVKKSSR